ncbi:MULTISPECIES: Dps family protein [unclassified Nostoc]|uniref:DNA starvation/stationary phase protection protein n=1 Tax=Nostoc punctiforme NIES-2108 TaxID=1356359 RepID=A0A367R5Z3_NOSPU|nr:MULTISPECIES: Dps family protein [unclassified Nostoc]MBN3875697.1 DNA starvation/stationary phase protection protein [Nostoc sp. JL23]MBN3890225.1 DNA starvation/stationary phase protection protein [Nostoc sp. JL31]RCJ30852.1 DNA starvation/stationary phase protection protein [Nostoc punctiforme NIES-2108]
MRSINIGLTEEQRQGVINLLNQDLADAYLLLVKTKKYHWDVVGPQFRSLHQLWEEHYQKLTLNIDALAERVRALGGYPVGTLEGFLKLATLKEHAGNVPTATGMVANLVDDHEQVIRNLRDHVDQSGEKFHDQGTADFLTGLLEQHEEIAWMLRSFIEGEAIDSDGRQPAEGAKTPVGV